MPKLSVDFKKYTAALIMFSISAGLVCFYLLFYVAKRDSEIKDRNFRVLNRTIRNINERIKDYDKLFESSIHLLNDANENIYANLSNEQDSLCSISEFIHRKCSKADTVYFDDRNSKNENQHFSIRSLDNVSYLCFNFKVNNRKPGSDILTLGARVDRFLFSILRKDAFTNYVLLQESTVLYKDFPQGFIIQAYDSLFGKNVRFKTNAVTTVDFSGNDYVLFIAPFEIGSYKHNAIIAIMPSSQFNTEKYSMPDSFVLTVLLILLTTLLSFPLLKALLMNEKERLKSMDVLSAFICFMLISGIIFFTFLNYYNLRFREKPKLDSEQKQLSESIRQSFNNDLTGAYRQLKTYDSLFNHISGNLTNLNSDDLELNKDSCKGNYDVCKKLLRSPDYKFFKVAFWMTENGDDSIRWTTEKNVPPEANYKDRDYFKRIKQNATWQLPGDPDASFSLQPIYSWTDGDFRAVVAMKSRSDSSMKKPLTAAISSRFPSVVNTVLPAGYKFCIVDEQGEVWFHSDTRKNLNENFGDECYEKNTLTSAMFSRTSSFFNSHYSGSDCRMYVTPLSNLPLYLVTIRDKSLYSTRNIEVFVITSILFLVLSGGFVLLLVVLILLKWKNSKLKNKYLQVEWLWPAEHNKENYIQIIFLNALILLVEFIFASTKYPLFDTFLFFSNCLVTVGSLYYLELSNGLKIHKNSDTNLFFVVMGVLITFLLIGCYFTLDSFHIVVIIVYLMVCCALTWLVLIRNKFSTKENVILQALNKRFPKSFKSFHQQSYIKHYSNMLFVWILVIVLLPVGIFYEIAYNYETENLLKYNQLFIAKEINQFTDNKTEGQNNHFEILNEPGKISNVYVNNNYDVVSLSSRKVTNPHRDDRCTKEAASFSGLIKKARIILNGSSANENELYTLDSRDRAYEWFPVPLQDSLFFNFTDVNKSKIAAVSGDTLTIVARPTLLNLFTMNITSITFDLILIKVCALLLLLILLYLLYSSIKYFINKFFLVDYFEDKIFAKNNPLYFNSDAINLNGSKTKSKIILISLPNSGKRKYLKEVLKAKGINKPVEIDFVLIENKEWIEKMKNVLDACPAKCTIILNHFEYQLSNEAANEKKLELMEYLLQKDILNIIISSIAHPSAFLSTLKTDKPKTLLSQFSSESNYYRWIMVFSTFNVFYYPLNRPENIPDDTTIDTLEKLVDKECEFGTFLNRHEKNIAAFNSNPDKEFSESLVEETILMIQHMSSPYYLSIWNSLTIDEQYVLHDMADDGLANYKNRGALTLLFYKGLIVHDDRIKIMNRSFRNFILEVNPENLLSDNAERQRGSNWQNFKMPFLVIGVVVLFFVFYTQQETFNKYIALIASFTASLPFILRLFTMIPSGKAEKA